MIQINIVNDLAEILNLYPEKLIVYNLDVNEEGTLTGHEITEFFEKFGTAHIEYIELDMKSSCIYLEIKE